MFLEFLNQSYFVIFNAIALIISLKTYSKYFDTVLKYLPIILAYTLLNEILGYFLLYYPSFRVFLDFEDSQTNHIIYNIFDIIFFPYFYYVYWSLIPNQRFKIFITIGGVLMLCAYLANAYFQNPMNYGLYHAYAIASLVLVICIFLYFWEKYEQNKVIWQKYNLVSWVSLGLLTLYSFSPVLLLIGYYDSKTWYDFRFQFVLHSLIIVMNIFFIIGFILSRKRSFG
ncbi:MAG: hypothetical protein WBB24_00610 [Maribacter sp.]